MERYSIILHIKVYTGKKIKMLLGIILKLLN